MDTFDHILKLADQYGFSAVVAFVLFVFIWRAGSWFGTQFVIPVRDAITVYLRDMCAWNRSLGKRLDTMQKDQADHHAREEEQWAAHNDTLGRVLDAVTQRPLHGPEAEAGR